jgi:hypothetical protein
MATRDRESYAQILFKVFHFAASKLDSSCREYEPGIPRQEQWRDFQPRAGD